MISFIIISGGDRAESIARLFTSIEKQAIPDYEIIVVGRHDGPLPDKARLVSRPGLADSAAICAMRNLGLDQAAGDPAILLDDDVEFTDGWHESLKGLLASDFDVASCRVITPAGDRWYDWAWASREDPSCPTRNLDYASSSPNVYVSGCFMAIRRKVFEKVRFNENLMNHQRDDVEFCHRVTDAGFDIDIFTEAHVIHHLDPAGRSASDPACGPDRFSRGVYLYRMRRHEEALRMFLSVSGPENVKSAYHAALCLAELGDPAEAIKKLHFVADNADINKMDEKRIYFSAHFRLGALMEGEGKPADAALCYKRALEGIPEHHEAALALARLSGNRAAAK